MSEIEKKSSEKKIKKLNKKFNIYIGYHARIVIYMVTFLIFIGLSGLLVGLFLNIEDEQVVSYRENGNSDYKVYLKPNNFYDAPYLGENMTYIASLIKNIDVDFNYKFNIGETVNFNLSYDIIGKLSISDESSGNVLFTKEYTLLDDKTYQLTNNAISIKESVSLDYDYYNNLVNSFKSIYGISADSSLTVYMKINDKITDQEGNSVLNDRSELSIEIPLSERTIDISIKDKEINTSGNLVTKKDVTFNNILFAVLAFISFVVSVMLLLRGLEHIFMLRVKKSNYDKFISKILKEYDRLIVETPTYPNFQNLNVIKIQRIEELLDVRDNLKLPIMYHNIVSHHKCCFYIHHNNDIYLMTVKATDLED